MAESTLNDLDEARRAFSASRWADAERLLRTADSTGTLAPEDLERLATCTFLLGEEEEYCRIIERAHQLYVESNRTEKAAFTAFWIGLTLMLRKQTGPAIGWLSRANRLVSQLEDECAVHGYLLLSEVPQHVGAGEFAEALAKAQRATAIGERYRDDDLIALARQLEGRAHIKLGDASAGLALLDETMVAVTAGELSPRVTGIIYCNVIAGCREVFAFARSGEWTAALTEWCARQPTMVAFTGRCLVHRAEILRFHGKWSNAVEEVGRARERLSRDGARGSEAEAVYEQAEIHRLRGEYDAAEELYQSVKILGRDPFPGLALLYLARGNRSQAESAICRSVESAEDPLERARLLEACTEIKLANGDVTGAAKSSAELMEIAEGYGTDVLTAMALRSRASASLGHRQAADAVPDLRRSMQLWQSFDAPYDVARVHRLLGNAYAMLGESDNAALEWTTAENLFQSLGAVPDAAEVRESRARISAENAAGLSDRELEVLQLIAAGKTNREIADQLFLSVKTVDRHVSNVFTKLDVSTRSAATAYAYEHHLV